MARLDGRAYDELRPLTITPDYTKYAEGSVLIRQGDTVVLCNASFTEGVPRHVKGTGRGWLTAEYDMLPRANRERSQRDIGKLKLSGRSAEIQRLIGRSLRSIIDLSKLGENTFVIDCDVLQGDGGTRCASITGGFVALYIACSRLVRRQILPSMPLRDYIAALGCVIVVVDVADRPVVDLNYYEDSGAVVDFNLIATGSGAIAEIQGTGEGRPYTPAELSALVDLALPAVGKVIEAQKEITRQYGFRI